MTQDPDPISLWSKAMKNQELPPEAEERMRSTLHTFRRRFPSHPAVQRRVSGADLYPLDFGYRIWNRFWAVGVAAASILFLVLFFTGEENPTWADVTRQFQSVPFCQASVYVKENPFAAPRQYDLWLGQQGKIRLRYGPQVIFSQHGVQKVYDVMKRREVEPDAKALQLIALLNSVETFSLEILIQSIAGDIADLQSLPNTVREVSQDLSVFDLANQSSGEWVRIWTLRESMLPIQLRKVDPRGGEAVDVLFSYLDQQPANFFDPRKFEEQMARSSLDPNDLAYVFLTDPANRPYTLRDLAQPVPTEMQP